MKKKNNDSMSRVHKKKNMLKLVKYKGNPSAFIYNNLKQNLMLIE